MTQYRIIKGTDRYGEVGFYLLEKWLWFWFNATPPYSSFETAEAAKEFAKGREQPIVEEFTL